MLKVIVKSLQPLLSFPVFIFSEFYSKFLLLGMQTFFVQLQILLLEALTCVHFYELIFSASDEESVAKTQAVQGPSVIKGFELNTFCF